MALHFVAVLLSFLFGPKESKPWRNALADTKDKRDEVLAAEKTAALTEEEARAAKIRAHEDAVADKKRRAAKAPETPAPPAESEAPRGKIDG